jgi:hypothetical protein
MGRIPAIEYLTKKEIVSYLADSESGARLVQSLQGATFELAARGDVDVREVNTIG